MNVHASPITSDLAALIKLLASDGVVFFDDVADRVRKFIKMVCEDYGFKPADIVLNKVSMSSKYDRELATRYPSQIELSGQDFGILICHNGQDYTTRRIGS